MTEDQYNSDGEELVKEEDKKKKSVAFKASSSSKNKDKSKKESIDDEDASDIDDEAMALFVRKMRKFMKKKGYGARKRRDHTKSKKYVRRCYSASCCLALAWHNVEPQSGGAGISTAFDER